MQCWRSPSLAILKIDKPASMIRISSIPKIIVLSNCRFNSVTILKYGTSKEYTGTRIRLWALPMLFLNHSVNTLDGLRSILYMFFC